MLGSIMFSNSISTTSEAPHCGGQWPVYAQDRAEALE
jgi:hypothetical protein